MTARHLKGLMKPERNWKTKLLILYNCKDCGNSFKGLGKKVVCPSCQSDNVELAE